MNEQYKIIQELFFTSFDVILEIGYIIAAVFFIVGLKKLSHPESAKRGNLLAGMGMGFALLLTLVFHQIDSEPIGNWIWIFGALAVGSVFGWLAAMRVKMTEMPQLVSFFNGMGGASAMFISLVEFPNMNQELINSQGFANGFVVSILAALVIGAVSFTGSLLAYGKLAGKVKTPRGAFLQVVNVIFLVAIIGISALLMMTDSTNVDDLMPYFYAIFGISLIYGITFVLPIGGADMPVVISLLNSLTGISAAMGGFLYGNQVMIIGGILVGSAGAILTLLMCKAMNRPLINVLVGSFGAKGVSSAAGEEGSVKESSISDAAVMLYYSEKVQIIPGYGLAAAQAQHLVRELDKLLEENGVEVKYAIHPVAGRMPGHMNVLLAEADVPYEKLIEMEESNDEMASTDVVIVIGANDVVNPLAERDSSSPVYGMPIIQAYKAKNILIMKRGMGKGYAGIQNPLFFDDKTRMMFGDAKSTLKSLVDEIKNL